jgi:hypothetical protein
MDPISITELRAERTNCEAAMRSMVDLARANDRDMTAEEAALFDQREADIVRIDNSILNEERVQRVAISNVERTIASEGDSPLTPERAPLRATPVADLTRPHGTLAIQMAVARVASKDTDPAGWARRNWDDELVATLLETPVDVLERAAVGVGDTATAGWAEELVSYRRSAEEFYTYLFAGSILEPFSGRNLRFGADRKVIIPRLDSGITASWVAEKASVPASEAATGELELTPAKIGSLTMLSNELITYSSPAAISIVRDDMIRQHRLRADATFISSTVRSAGVNPGGILASSPTTTASIAATAVERITADASAAAKALAGSNVPRSNWTWVLHSDQVEDLKAARDGNGNAVFKEDAQRGILNGVRIIESNSQPATIVALIANDEVFVATGRDMRVDTSLDAAVLMDTAPNPATGTWTSAFQTDSLALRGIVEMDWMKRFTVATFVIPVVSWS